MLLADAQSQVTAQSRFTVGSNVYSIVDSQRSILEDIDMKIRQCNPDAQILPITAGQSTQGLKQGFDKNLPKQGTSTDSDAHSQFSMPVSGISRRSDFTTISLSQNPKNLKLPGDKSLKAKAEERQQRARLMEIERYLNQIRDSDDLSYNEQAQQMSVLEQSTDGSGRRRNLIDEETLLRLVDECKDEEARLSVMQGPDLLDQKAKINSRLELTQLELWSFNAVQRKLDEADELKQQAQTIMEQVDRELLKPIEDFEALADREQKQNALVETKLVAAQKEVTKFKTKVETVFGDMQAIGE